MNVQVSMGRKLVWTFACGNLNRSQLESRTLRLMKDVKTPMCLPVIFVNLMLRTY